MRPSRPLQLLAAVLAAALLVAPAAQASVVFRGFPAEREQALRADLGKSLFPFAALLDVVVRPGSVPDGALAFASDDGKITISDTAFSDDLTRAFTLFHELSHQIDFQILRNEERRRYYSAAGFGPGTDVVDTYDKDWYDESLGHTQIAAEQFASAVALAVWPVERGNIFVGADGSCIGWAGGEGCAAPLSLVRKIVNAILRQQGFGALKSGQLPSVAVQIDYRPPKLGTAPAEGHALRTPDAGPTPVATALAPIEPVTGVRTERHSVLQVRLTGPGGGLPGVTVLLDYQDAKGWWRLPDLTTAADGVVSYPFRPQGWRPTAFRVTFVGVSNLQGTSLVVPVSYAK